MDDVSQEEQADGIAGEGGEGHGDCEDVDAVNFGEDHQELSDDESGEADCLNLEIAIISEEDDGE